MLAEYFSNSKPPLGTASPYYWIKDDKHRVIYLCIPKNANSLLRAIFLANNFKDFDHKNESALEYQERTSAKLEPRDVNKVMKKRKYKKYRKIVLLRDPFSRLVSAYLDKVAKPEFKDHDELKETQRRWLGQLYDVMTHSLDRPVDRSNITFSAFVAYAINQPDRARDPHWRSQSSFMASYTFDFYGDVGNIEPTLELLRENGIDTNIGAIKSPKNTPYSLFKTSDEPAWNANLSALNSQQCYPKAEEFYSRKILARVKRTYMKDIEAFCDTQNIAIVDLLAKYTVDQ